MPAQFKGAMSEVGRDGGNGATATGEGVSCLMRRHFIPARAYETPLECIDERKRFCAIAIRMWGGFHF